MRIIFSFLMLFVLSLGAASAQTYLGDGGGTSGYQGTCCNWVAITAGASCPAEQVGAHPTCQVITSGQYSAFQAAHANDYDVQYPIYIKNGVALTSTGTSSLNGTYPLDPRTQGNVLGLYFRAKTIGTNFAPGGGTTVALFDQSNQGHLFDSTHMIAYGDALAQYLGELTPQSVTAFGWPANNAVTIP